MPLWIQSNKFSICPRFWRCKWVWGYLWTWATDQTSFLVINSAIFLSGLGEVDFAVVSFAVKKCLRKTSKRGAYKVYTSKDCYSIGKYANCHGLAASVRAWKKTYPNLNESTVRGFKKRYKAKLKEASRRKISPKKKPANKMRGRPTLLGQKLDTLVQTFLRASRYKHRNRASYR